MSDKALLFNLANEYSARKNSFNKCEISIDEHSTWFKRILNNKKFIIYIAYCKNNIPIGQIRFELQEKNFFIDFSIEKASRGCGLGYELVASAIKRFDSEEYKYEFLIADVLINNIPSIKIFKSLNFSEKNFHQKGIKRFCRKNTNY